METILFILVILLFILILILLGILIVLVYKLYRSSSLGTETPENSLLSIAKANAAQEVESIGQKCVDHPELDAKGICSITDEPYCELCITKEKDVKFARKFLNLVLDSEWQTFFFESNKALGADKLNELYKIKKDLWKKQQIPLITQKQFKINIETDEIEAFTLIMARSEDIGQVEAKLDFLNS